MKLRIISFIVTAVSATACLLTYSVLNQEAGVLKTRKIIIFRIDNTFSAKDIKSIDRAMLRWESATCNLINLSWYVDEISPLEIFSWKSDGIPTIYNASRSGWKRFVASTLYRMYGLLGVSFDSTGDVFIVDDRPSRLEVLATHEIGHVLVGGYHSADSSSVMYPTLGEDTGGRILDEDVSLVRKRLGVRQ